MVRVAYLVILSCSSLSTTKNYHGNGLYYILPITVLFLTHVALLRIRLAQVLAIMSLQWVPKSNGEYVDNGGVHAGVDSGNELYVARAYHDGAIVPGKLHVSHSSVYIPYNMSEIPVQNYEVLVAPIGSLSWIDSEGGAVPSNAVVGGQTNDGETLYIGRVLHNGTVTVGKIHPSHGCCYFPYGGEELSAKLYEVLIKNAFGRHLGL